MPNEAKHISVLLNECIENLDIKPDGIYVDGEKLEGDMEFVVENAKEK